MPDGLDQAGRFAVCGGVPDRSNFQFHNTNRHGLPGKQRPWNMEARLQQRNLGYNGSGRRYRRRVGVPISRCTSISSWYLCVHRVSQSPLMPTQQMQHINLIQVLYATDSYRRCSVSTVQENEYESRPQRGCHRGPTRFPIHLVDRLYFIFRALALALILIAAICRLGAVNIFHFILRL